MSDADDALRALPSVDRLATAVARAELAERRAALLDGAPAGTDDLVAAARRRLRPSLRRVLNATGVVVHTNLGRAPLGADARAAVAEAAAGYSNLELDLDSGRRGSRHDHVAALLCELTGAEAAIAVNNCAAATLLAVAALAGPGREVVVSRGQLIEIGGAFRIPEVIAQAGAQLVEVGTTNRTRLDDYRRALSEHTGVVLRAHPSNFRTVGFVEEVGIEELCGLGVPVVDDVGSGVLAGELELLAAEPPVRRSVRAGAAAVAFSGDKLLGGPQAGLLAGRAEAIERCARHPLARAVRIDKLAGRAGGDAAPVPRSGERGGAAGAGDARRTGRGARRAPSGWPRAPARIVSAVARAGGGALPLLELRGPAVALDPGPGGADASPPACAAGTAARRAHPRRPRLLDPRTLGDDGSTPRSRRCGPRGDERRAGTAQRSRADDHQARPATATVRIARACPARHRREPRGPAHARHRRPHRLRQDRARARAHRPRHRPPARRARPRDLHRGTGYPRRSTCPAAAACRSSTSPATSASGTRWSRARPGSTCSC
ncbi:MAG: L-seryl-tRNA(Sec) selenium transferase [Solirubrobacterales bacterium]